MRVATAEDIDEIEGMAMEFMDSTGYTTYADVYVIRQLIANIINGPQNERIIVLEPDKGFIAGASVPFIFGPHLVATEIAWWVDPLHRKEKVGGQLLEAFEYWAKEKAKCTLISMVTLEESLDKLYTNKGYKLYERAYMKEL